MKNLLILAFLALSIVGCGNDNNPVTPNNPPPVSTIGDLILSQDSIKLFWTNNNSYLWSSYSTMLSLDSFESITWKFDYISTNLTTNESQFNFRFAAYGSSDYDTLYYGNQFSTLNNFSKTMYADSSGYTQFNSINPGIMIRFDDLNTPQPDKYIVIKNIKLYRKWRL
jgi:hypothetical protein